MGIDCFLQNNIVRQLQALQRSLQPTSQEWGLACVSASGLTEATSLQIRKCVVLHFIIWIVLASDTPDDHSRQFLSGFLSLKTNAPGFIDNGQEDALLDD